MQAPKSRVSKHTTFGFYSIVYLSASNADSVFFQNRRVVWLILNTTQNKGLTKKEFNIFNVFYWLKRQGFLKNFRAVGPSWRIASYGSEDGEKSASFWRKKGCRVGCFGKFGAENFCKI